MTRRRTTRGGEILVPCLVGAALALALCILPQSAAQDDSERLASRETVASRLKAFSTDNGERESRIRKWLAEAGCKRGNLSEQYVERQVAPELDASKEQPQRRPPQQFPGAQSQISHDRETQPTREPPAPPNVICVLSGQTTEAIVVAAHTDKVEGAGDGVVDNWSGAALLPSLVFSLEQRPRRHTFVFVGFTAEEKGLVGSAYYAAHLSRVERTHVAAVVNLDSLGLGPTEVWASHADKVLLEQLMNTAASVKLPVSEMNVDQLGTADSESFAPYHIPRITLHSVKPENWRILHSSRDTVEAIRFSDYYDSYRLIAAYLDDLDRELGKPPAPAEPPK
jgi:Zn-dependent M28 family amino/carboxypeptidase